MNMMRAMIWPRAGGAARHSGVDGANSCKAMGARWGAPPSPQEKGDGALASGC